MVDSVIFPLSGRVIVDANGTPLSGAKLEVFDAGTSNQQTVYSDSDLATSEDNPIETNASGVVPVRYIGTTAYKVTFKDSSDATLSNYETWDNVKGAVDTSSFLTGTVSPSRAVVTESSSFTSTQANLGKHHQCDATGGSITASLFSAITAGDGADYVFKHSGTANEVILTPTGGQTIDGKTTFILYPGDSVTTRSDGANWIVSEAFKFTDGIVTITFDPSITPDFSHASGTDYQITLTADTTINAPTNLRQGTKGTITLVQDATGGHEVTFNSIFKGTVALNQSADAVNVLSFHARTTSDIDFWKETGRYSLVGIVEDQKAQNTAAGGFTTGAWEQRDLNTAALNTIGITIGTNDFVLPPGDYRIDWSAPAMQVNLHQSRLFDVTGAAAVDTGTSERADATVAVPTRSEGSAFVTISADTTYRIDHQCQTTKATDGFGIAANFGIERYTIVKIWAR